MISRYLEKKVELMPVDGLIGCKGPVELEYYLLESEANEYEELKQKKVYGIEIVKKESNSSIESELIRNFSCCRENTKQVLKKLANNTVTPVGLPFILDDLLGM